MHYSADVQQVYEIKCGWILGIKILLERMKGEEEHGREMMVGAVGDSIG